MAVEIVLTDSERAELGQRVRRRKIGRADAMHVETVLLAADGLNNRAIAEELVFRGDIAPAILPRSAWMVPTMNRVRAPPRKIGDDRSPRW